MSVPTAGFLLTMLLLLLSCSIVDSVPLESAPVVMYSGHPQPERWILYDLEQPFGPLIASNSTELSVERRTAVTVCERIITVAAGCAVSINAIKDFSKWAAGNCDTTAEEKTIERAVLHHIKTTDGSKVCYTECLDLTHGGTWDGYLLIGPSASFDANQYCGPRLSRDSFKDCSSGGKKDAS
ncbi:unnamed protein product [Cercospora beticola]|nr:unnamed protein product [Cercospora beticola]